MTKKEAFEYLKETKIFVDNNSEKLQKKLFEIGFKWATGEQKIQYTDKPFLYLYNNRVITYGTNIEDFCSCSLKLLKVQEILKIKIDDIKIHEFKPFDRVLVRDWDTEHWKIELFEKYDETEKDYPYVCLNFRYKQCIHFEGNEHLLWTTNKPE